MTLQPQENNAAGCKQAAVSLKLSARRPAGEAAAPEPPA